MMYDEIVGMDVLPNVYIERMLINKDSEIEVVLKMFDYETTKSWRDVEFAENLEIRIMCYITNDENEIESLNFGSSILRQHYYPTRGVILSCNSDFDSESVVDGGFMYTCSVKFDLGIFSLSGLNKISDIENLNVYATTFVDGFDFDQEEYQSIFGALFGEKIVENNQLVTESGHFFLQETGEEYSGPVHLHPDSSLEDTELVYMEGSNHSSMNHRNVYYYREENFKIIDLREEI